MKKYILLLFMLFVAPLFSSEAFGTIIVGRIAHVEGRVYRYMDVDQSWVETFHDSPAGTGDILAAGDNGRVELRFPNNMVAQLDGGTEIEIVTLAEDTGEFLLRKGLVRFHNMNTSGMMTVETGKGHVSVGPETGADVQVNTSSVVIAAVRGEVTFQAIGTDTVEVISGDTRLEFHNSGITAGVGPIDRDWDDWCLARQDLRRENQRVHSEHLPETMQEYAYVLEPNGSWQRVYYRGYYYWAWQPRHVPAGWAPYTTGYWYDWWGDPVWIDHNPWGWVTHHHGHWINMRNVWMWTPYIHVSHVPGVTVVGFNITFGKRYRPYWHPGRVRWISHTDHIGWLPLAPWETYYGYRRWGPRSVRVLHEAGFTVRKKLAKHRHIRHAVIIPRHRFKNRGHGAVRNYDTVRIRNVDRTVIISDYKPIVRGIERKQHKHAEKIGVDYRAGKKAAARYDRDHSRRGRVVEIPRHGWEKERQAAQVRKQEKRDRGVSRTYRTGTRELRQRSIPEKQSLTREITRKRIVTTDTRERTVKKKQVVTAVKERHRLIRGRKESSPAGVGNDARRDSTVSRQTTRTSTRYAIRKRTGSNTAMRDDKGGRGPRVSRQAGTIPRKVEKRITRSRGRDQVPGRSYIENRKQDKTIQKTQQRTTREYGYGRSSFRNGSSSGPRRSDGMSVSNRLGRGRLR